MTSRKQIDACARARAVKALRGALRRAGLRIDPSQFLASRDASRDDSRDASRDDETSAQGVHAPWRAYCAGSYTLHDSYHRYKRSKILD